MTFDNTPQRIDALGRRDGLGIHHVRDLIPKECFEIDPKRAWAGLVAATLRLAAAEWLLYMIEPTKGTALLWQVPALSIAWIFAGWAFTGLFVIGHDCAHQSFSEKKWVNSLVGYLTLAPTFTGFHSWRIWHNHHHARTQMRKVDPDWSEKSATRAEYDAAGLGQKAHVRLGFGTPLGVLLGFWVGMTRRVFMRSLAPNVPLSRGADRELFVSTLFWVSFSVVLGSMLVHATGFWGLCKYWLVPAFIAAAHGALLTFLHHAAPDSLVFDREAWTPFRGQVVSTFNVRFPRICEAMWFDINIHLPHHIAPKLPWYNLRRAALAIQAARPDLYLERRFSWAYLISIWEKPLLSPVAGAYRAASFDEEPAEVHSVAR